MNLNTYTTYYKVLILETKSKTWKRRPASFPETKSRKKDSKYLDFGKYFWILFPEMILDYVPKVFHNLYFWQFIKMLKLVSFYHFRGVTSYTSFALEVIEQILWEVVKGKIAKLDFYGLVREVGINNYYWRFKIII